MIVTKKSLSRRAVLRGMGTVVALPLLDAIVPALNAQVKTPARSVRSSTRSMRWKSPRAP